MSGSATILPLAETQFLDANGNPLAGGKVWFFVPSTTTPKATWQDAAQTTLNTNPVVLDSAGRALIYGAGTYRQQVYDSMGVLQWDQVTQGDLPTSIVQNGTTVQPTALSITRNEGVIGDADLVDITQTVTYVGGSGIAQALQVLSTVGNTGTGSAMDGPGVNVWNMNARLYSTALQYSGAGPVDSQHVSLQARAMRDLPSGGVPAGRKMASVWGVYIPVTDSTNLPSSISGSMNGYEMDIAANNLDDDMQRQGAQIIAGPQIALADGGYPGEIGRMITFSGHDAPSGQPDGFCKFGIWAGVNYSISLLDTRTGGQMNTTVATTLTAPSTTVALVNVWGFTSAGALGQPITPSNPSNVTINGTTYSQIGFTTTAGSTAGTITLASPVSVADGTAGNSVKSNGHTIWLGTGQDIALSSDGSANISIDESGGFVFKVFSGPVMTLSGAGEALLQGNILCQSIGLFGAGAPGQQTVTGSRGGNAALASLLTALVAYGLIKDNTTA